MSELRVADKSRRASVAEVRLKMADRDGLLSWLFLVPTVVYIIALVGIPFALAIAFAFSDVTTGDSSFQWVGFKNFQLIFQDPVFWTALWNTLWFTAISLVLIVVLGGLLAEILAADFHGKWVVRFLILLPWTTPVALSSVAWLWLLDSIYSPIDWVLRAWGLIEGNMYWLGEPTLAQASVIAVQVWRIVPLAAVIMLVGLLSIPKDIPEAARVDGAGYWRRMFEITMPLTAPLIAVAALFGAIFIFTDMTVPYILTRGGPTNTTQVLASWSYVRGIAGGDIGQGAAIALFLFPLLLAAAVAILRSVRKMETF
ncbi:MAG: sugar ABC transporter permease [Terrimesophilobacter sp.]